ncbi:Uncharacterized protein APZ42_020954 [Daphnia magna]|uniref:Uncharacterized protein n=1 Tax=Daphnia magna TaxID=35525 RepID=A0A164X4I4_9CRUS|nr:Uncharacterized protein APZ42_020954 [Daphnia magna]
MRTCCSLLIGRRHAPKKKTTRHFNISLKKREAQTLASSLDRVSLATE